MDFGTIFLFGALVLASGAEKPTLSATQPTAAIAASQPTRLTSEQQAELARHFGFGPLQIYKLKIGLSDLRLADLNGDGRVDVVLWNGHQSRFELFYQPDPNAPVSEEARNLDRNELPNRGALRNENIPVAYKVAALEVADVTGDGRADIVFFGEPKELVVLPSKAGGGLGAPESLRAPDGNPRNGCLAAGDFDHDGRTDVALLGSDVLLVYRQKEQGGLAPPLRLVHGIKNPMLMLRADVNGDGRDDLIIGADDERYGVYVCLQEESGTLAALRPVRIPRLRSMSVARPLSGKGGDDLYGVEQATNRLKHYRWELPRDAGVAGDWPPRLHSYPVKSTSKQRPLALGDVDGDGLADCVTADPEAAQLILFRGEADGLGAGAAYPGLVKMTDVQVVDLDGDGRLEVVVASAQEKLIGVSHFAQGRLTYPSGIAARGEPYAVAVGSLKAGEKADRLAYVTKEDDDFKLVVRGLGAGAEEATYRVDRLDDDPAGLRFVDVNQDGRNDLLLFVRYATPKTYLQTEDGKFELFSGAEKRTSLLKDASLAAFAVADINGDGKPEVIVAQENLARALVVRDGRWTVVDQYSPETADVKLTGLTALPRAGGAPQLVMYDKRAGDVLVFQQREDRTYALAQTMPVGTFELTATAALPIGRDGKVALLLADPARLAVLTPDERAPTLVEQDSYESETKDAFLADAVVGDVNHDGVRDIALVDMGKASLEILTTLPGGQLVRAMRIQVFQGKRFADAPDAYGEPREVLVGDVTGDGIDDVVVIAHDRLIVYPGE